MISFSYPIVLFLIPIVLIIWYVFFREKFGAIYPNHLIAKYLKNPKIIIFLWIIRSLLITIVFLILASTSIIQTITTKNKLPQDIMIVFDISLSMLAEDISPNRIEVAKTVVRDFISSRTSDRIGLVIFSGKPFVSIPFSTDYSGIKSMISGLSPYLIRQDLPGLSGTNIGDAILLANMSHSGGKSPEKSIILLTDGRANVGIDPIIASQESVQSHIKVYTIGIGSPHGGDLFYTDSFKKKIYFYDEKGNKLQADLDEPMMQKIAETTQGKYYHADNRVALENIFSEIEKKLPSTVIEKTETKHIDLTLFFLLLLLIIIGIERGILQYILKKYKLIQDRNQDQ